MARKSVNEYSPDDKRRIKEIDDLNDQFRKIMSSEFKSIEGGSAERRDHISRLHNQFLDLVHQDVQNVNRQKSPNQSTYDYIVRALTGREVKNPNDAKEKSSLRKQFEDLLSASDSEITSYFMSNGMSNLHIYDEIDSICAYMYQLEEAVDIIAEGVLASEEVSEGISMDVKFEGMVDKDTSDYKTSIFDMFRNEGMTRRLRSHVVKKTVKHGLSRIMVIPYSDISDKLNNLRGGYGTQENMTLFESADGSETGEYTFESACQDVAEILDINVPSDKNKVKNVTNKPESDESKKMKRVYDTICENLKTLTVCENDDLPNIFGGMVKGSTLDDSMIDTITKAMKESHKELNSKVKPRKGTKEYSEGLVDKDALDGIKGCYQKVVDPRQMKEIKIFDYTIGYYYFENYQYEYSGTTITDMLSNMMVFDQKTQAIDRLVDSVIGKLKYGDILSGDKQFRNLILNCLMYVERRDNPIRIKFIPKEYVVEFKTNMDEHENGQPVLLRSLFFARLYISMLLFYVTALVTKSTDSEFYYLRESALDPNFENQVTDLIDQLQQCNFDPIAVANGQLLSATKAINKKYFMSLGVSGEKMFDIDVMSGQQIDINTEFLTMLKKMAISSTGVASLMIDMVDEVEYATLANMSNIKTMKRCNTIQEDINGSLTDYARIIAKYTTNIPEDVISRMYITLKPNKIAQNNITANQLNDVIGTAQNMVKVYYKGEEESDATEFEKLVIDRAVKALTIELSSSAPWGKLENIIKEAELAAKEDEAKKNMNSTGGDGDSSDSY